MTALTAVIRALANAWLPANEIAALLLFGTAALGKLVDPRPTLEQLEPSVGNAQAAIAVFTAVTALEGLFAWGVARRIVTGHRCIGIAVVLLLGYAAWLQYVREAVGSHAPCGCWHGFGRGTAAGAQRADLLLAGEMGAVLVVTGLRNWRRTRMARKPPCQRSCRPH